MDAPPDEVDPATLEMIMRLQQEEIHNAKTSLSDHEFALSLNEDDENATATESNDTDALQAKVVGMYLSKELAYEMYAKGTDGAISGSELGTAESSQTASAGQATANHSQHCVACGDLKDFFEIVKVPCGDLYCADCIKDLFSAAVRDESFFPPRCCRQNIDIDTVKIFVNKELQEELEKKRVEFGTQDRTYCSQAECGTFINPTLIEHDLATCPDCGSRTCALCKDAEHLGSDCPQDPALQEVLQLANENGWKRCSSCRRMIELTIGCNHITYVEPS